MLSFGVVLTGFGLTSAAAGPAPATQAAEEERKISFNFKSMPMPQVLRQFSKWVGKPIIGADSTTGRLTYYTRQKYTIKEAFNLLKEILLAQNRMIVEKERYYRVTTTEKAGPEADIYFLDELKDYETVLGDLGKADIITLIYRLRNNPAAEVKEKLSFLNSSFGKFLEFPGNRMFITDSVAKLDKIFQIIKLIESEEISLSKFRTFKLQHVMAQDAKAMIVEMFRTGAADKAAASRTQMYQMYIRSRRYGRRTPTPAAKKDATLPDVSIAVDTRTNMLLVHATEARLSFIEQIIKLIDVPVDDPGQRQTQIRTVAVKFAGATEAANYLNQVIKAINDRAGKKSTFKAIPEPRSEKLIICSDQDEWTHCQQLLEEIDQIPDEPVVQVRQFKLEHAEADKVSKVLADMLRSVVTTPSVPARPQRGRRPQPKRSAGSVAGTRLRVIPDTRTNSVFVSGNEEELTKAAELVAMLDKSSPNKDVEIRTYELNKDVVQSVANSLKGLFGAAASRRGRTPSPTGVDVKFEGNPYTGILLVRAPLSEFPEIEKTIDKLTESIVDVKQNIKIFDLEVARASQVVEILNGVFGGQSRPASRGRGRRQPRSTASGTDDFRVVPDPNANRVFVQAGGEMMDRIAKLIADIDKEKTTTDDRQFRIVSLPTANASDVAWNVRNMRRMPAFPRDDYDGPTIEADWGENRLLISARAPEMAKIMDLVRKFDDGATEGSTGMASARKGVRLLRTSGLQASEMARIIKRLYEQGEGEGIVTIKKTTDVLPGLRPKAEDDVDKTEANAGPLPGPATTQPPEAPATAPAEEPAPATAKTPDETAKPEPKPEKPEVEIIVDEQTGSIILRGPDRELDKLQQIIDLLTGQGDPEKGEVRIYPLRHADASQMADILNSLINPQPRRVARPRQPAQRGRQRRPTVQQPQAKPRAFIVADKANNRLIIRTSMTEFFVIESLIAKFDQVTIDTKQVQIRAFRLGEGSQATEVVSILRDVLGLGGAGATPARRAPARRGRTPTPVLMPSATGQSGQNYRSQLIRLMKEYGIARGQDLEKVAVGTMVISAVQATNSVVVTAPEPHLELVGILIKEITSEDPETKVVLNVVHLEHAEDVQEVVDSVLTIFSAGRAAARGRGRQPARTTSTQINIKGNQITKTILVRAPKKDWDDIHQIILELDVPEMQRMTEKIVLKHAEADPVAETIRSLLQQTGGTGIARRGRRTAPVAGAGGSQVTIITDSRTRSLVVKGTKTQIAEVKLLVAELDVPLPGGSPVRKVFALENAAARTVAQMISQQFGTGATTFGRGRVRGGRPAGGAGTSDTIKVATEETTNCVIVTAPKETMDEIVALIKEIDEGDGLQFEVRTYKLVHAKAQEIYQTLLQLYQQQSGAARPTRGRAPRTGSSRNQPLAITANPVNNSIVASGKGKDFDLVKLIIDQLDVQVPAEQVRTTKIYNLKKVDAQSVARSLAQAFVSGGGAAPAPRGRGRWNPRATTTPQAGEPIIAPEPTSNSLIVKATVKQHEQIAVYIQQFEDGSPAGTRVETVKLQWADPTLLATKLNEFFQARSGGGVRRAPRRGTTGGVPQEPAPVITPVPHAKSLICSGGPESMKVVKELVAVWDVEATKEQQIVREIFVLKVASASEVADTIMQSFGSQGTARRGPRRRTPTVADPSEQVVAVAQQASNVVVVTASQAKMTDIRDLVSRLDAQTDGEMVRRVFALKNAQADAVAQMITQQFGSGNTAWRGSFRRRGPGAAGAAGKVKVTPETGGNSVVVTAPEKIMVEIAELIDVIDKGEGRRFTVRTYTLKNAKAEEVHRTITELYQRQTTGAARRGRMPRTGSSANQPLAITFNINNNTIVASGRGEDFELIAKMIEQLDVPIPPQQIRTTKVYSLQKADAQSVARSLSQAFAPSGTPARAPRRGRPGNTSTSASGAPIIAPERTSNSLIVNATATQHTEIALYIEQIESKSVVGATVELVFLKHADPTPLARKLTEFFGQRQGGVRRGRGRTARGPQEPTPVLTPIPHAKALLVSAGPESWAVVREMVGIWDVEGVVDQRVREVFVLKVANAREVADAIMQSFDAQGPGRRAPRRATTATDSEDRIVAVAQQASNVVVVTASADKMKEVRTLVTQLDASADGEPVRRVFALKNADADAVAQMISQQFDSGSTSYRGNWNRRSRGAAVPAGKIRVSPDTNSNTLVVNAPEMIMVEIAELIDEIDKGEGQKFEVKTYPLKHAKAEEVHRTITELYQRQTTGAARRGRMPRPGSSANQPLAITFNINNNTIIASGRGGDFELVAKIITELDVAVPPEQVRTTKIYTLTKADAQSVAQSLAQTFAPAGGSRTPAFRRRNVRTPAATGGAGAPIIAPEPTSNSLIVKATEAQHTQIADYIEKIEAGSPMGAKVKTIALKDADPTQLAAKLNEFFQARAGSPVRRVARGRGRTPGGVPQEPAPVITPVQHTKTLVVSAGPESMTIIDELVGLWDVPLTEEQQIVREVIVLKVAQAREVADAITQSFNNFGRAQAARGRFRRGRVPSGSDPSQQVIVTPQQASNVIVVTAPMYMMQRIRFMVQRMDVQGGGELASRIIELKHAQAEEIEPILQDVVQQQIRGARGRGRRTGPQTTAMSIKADARTNTIIVYSTEDDYKRISDLVAKLDQDVPDDKETVQILVMETGDAMQMASTLKQTFVKGTTGGRGRGRTPQTYPLRINGERSTNSVIVAGRKDLVREAVAAYETIMAGQTVGKRVRQTFKLKTASATELHRNMERFFSRRDQEARRLKLQPDPVHILPDAQSRTLVVEASEGNMQMVGDMIAEFDKDTGQKIRREVITVSRVDPEQAARAIRQVYPRSRNQDPLEQVEVFAPRGGREIVTMASDKNLAEIKALVASLDKPAEGEGDIQIKVFPLTHVEAIDVLWNIRDLYEQMIAGRIDRNRRLTLTDNYPNNELLASGPAADDFALIEKILVMIDRKPDDDSKIKKVPRVYNLVYVDATATARALEQVFAQKFGERQKEEKKVSVAAEPATNSIIVTASVPMHDEIKAMIDELDRQHKARFVDERVVLKFARAEEMVQMLDPLVQALGYTAARSRTPQRGRRGRTPAAAAPRGTQPLGISADTRTNSVLITGAEGDVAKVVELIKKFDVQAPDAHIVQVVTLDHATATEAARALQEAWQLKTRGRTAKPSEISVSAMQSSNALLIKAPKLDMAELLDTVAKIDAAPPADERRTREVYVVVYADARTLARTVEASFQPDKRSKVNVPESQRVQAFGDAANKTVVVVANAENHARIAKMIKDVDVAPVTAQRQTFKLAEGRAERIAPMLEQMFAMPGRPRPGQPDTSFRVLPDAVSNTVMASTVAGNWAEFAQAVKDLDKSDTFKREVFVLKHITADQAAAVIEAQIFHQAPKPQRGRTTGSDNRPRATGDRNSKILVVSATEEDLVKIRTLVKQMDVPTDTPITQTVVLTTADASKVAEYLKLSRGTRGKFPMTFVANVGANSVYIRGLRQDVEEAVVMAKEMDASGAVEGTTVHVLLVANADPAELVRMLKTIYRKDMTGRDARLAIDYDATAQALVINAPPRLFAEIRGIVDKLELNVGRQAIQIIRLHRVDPKTITDLVKQAQQNGARPGRRGPEGDPGRTHPAETQPAAGISSNLRVTAHPDTGALLVSGSEEEIKAFQALIDELEAEAKKSQGKLKVFVLKHAIAQEVTQILTQMFRDLEAARPRRGPRATVRAHTAANMVIVVADEEMIARAKELIDQLDQETAIPPLVTEIFKLKNTRVELIIDRLTRLLTQMKQQTGRKDRASIIQVEADPAGNAIIVMTAKENLADIRKLVELFDQERPGITTAEIVWIPLQNAKAMDLVNILQSMISGSKSGTTPGGTDLSAFIRRLRLRTAGGEQVPELDLDQPVLLIPSEGSNSVFVSSSKGNLASLEAMIALLDKIPTGEEVSVRVFTLKHADVSLVQTMFEDLFKQAKEVSRAATEGVSGQPKGVPRMPTSLAGQALMDEVRFAVDPRLQVLLVAGKEKSLALVEAMLKQIDVEPTERRGYKIRTITLQRNDAARISDMLGEIVKERNSHLTKTVKGAVPEPVVLLPDPRTNSILISATEVTFKEFEALVKRMEGMPPSKDFQFRIVGLDKQVATRMQQVLTDLFKQRRDRGKGLDVAPPVIIADDRSNSLICAASPEDFQTIQDTVGRLEKIPFKPAMQVYVRALKHNDAAQVGKTIEQLINQANAARPSSPPEDKVVILTDPMSNTLLIAANKDNYARITGLLDQLDHEPDVEGIVRTIGLKFADALEMKQKLDDLFKGGLFRPGGPTSARTQADKVTIVADQRSATLIVSASPPNFAVVKDLVERMDRAPKEMVNVQIFRVRQTVPTQLQATVQKALDAQPLAPGQSKPSVMAHDRNSSLVVVAPRDMFPMIAKLISDLDKGRVSTRTFKPYSLKRASATMVAATLDKMFVQARKQTPTGPPVEPVEIQADPRGHQVLVRAAPEDHVEIAEIIQQLDVDPGKAAAAEIFLLKRAKAQDVAKTIKDLFSGTTEERGLFVTVSVQESNNSLVVVAPEGDMQAIAALVKRMDEAVTTKTQVVRIIRLNEASCENLVDTLDKALQGGPRGQAAAERIIRFVQEGDSADPGAGLLRRAEGLLDEFTLEPVPRINAVMLAASAEAIDVLQKIIEELDRPRKSLADVRVYPLKNADAAEMVELLEKLFQLDQRSAARTSGDFAEREVRLRLTGAGPVATPVAAPGGEEAGSSLVPLNITSDERTNTVLVSGGPSDLDSVERLIFQLDADEREERIQEIYAARNVEAGVIVKAVQDFYKQRSRQATETEGATLRELEQEVYVTGVEESSRILIDANPRYLDQIKEIITELDQPPAQVLIQVILAEIRLDESNEWGFESTLRDLHKAPKEETGSKRPGRADITSGTDFSVRGRHGAVGGFSFDFTTEDLDFFLRALQTDGKLEILSRPQIQASDNMDAKIHVGEEVPILRESRITNDGQTVNSVTQEPVGIILAVKPQVNPDGFVKLLVEAEISSLSESTVQISEGTFAPVITKRILETTVTVKDGHTIIIGGLINTINTRQQRKVPILGDIPILGLLFRSEIIVKDRRELVIILTPCVSRTPKQLQAVTKREMERAGAASDSIRRSNMLDQDGCAKPKATEQETKPATPDPNSIRRTGYSSDPNRPGGSSGTPGLSHRPRASDRR